MFRNKYYHKMVFTALAVLAVGVAASLYIGKGQLWIMTLAGLADIVIFSYYTGLRYRELARLAREVHSFQRGSSRIDLESYSEGELSYLSSEIGKMAVKLTEQAELLEQDKNYLADAISDISHQLKTPLTSMSMMADFLRSPNLTEAKREEFTGNIRTQLARIEWLVSALLKMARLDAGAVLLKSRPVNVRELVDKASAHLLIPMELKNQRLVVECDPQLSFMGDMEWMSEALANILKNCMEHMDAGKTLRVAAQKNPLYVRLDIIDEGCGIDREDLPHIFERFYKGKNASSDSVGIGLAMAAQIIHQLGGDIRVESAPGAGTHFEIKMYPQH